MCHRVNWIVKLLAVVTRRRRCVRRWSERSTGSSGVLFNQSGCVRIRLYLHHFVWQFAFMSWRWVFCSISVVIKHSFTGARWRTRTRQVAPSAAYNFCSIITFAGFKHLFSKLGGSYQDDNKHDDRNQDDE